MVRRNRRSHERSHYPRRPRPVNRPAERRPELEATTPRTRRQRPPVVRYVPIVRRMRRYRPAPVEPPTEPSTFEAEIEFGHRNYGWFMIALMMFFNAGVGYYAYSQHPVWVFFPGETKWLFWLMTACTLWIAIDKLMGEEE